MNKELTLSRFVGIAEPVAADYCETGGEETYEVPHSHFPWKQHRWYRVHLLQLDHSKRECAQRKVVVLLEVAYSP